MADAIYPSEKRFEDKTEVSTVLLEEGVSPSSDRLLRSLQITLREMATRVVDDRSRAELSTIDVVLSELLSRARKEFYVEHYLSLRSLLVEGLALFRPHLPATEVATIVKELVCPLASIPEREWGYDSLSPRINRVLQHLAILVRSMHDIAQPESRDFLGRLVAKENEFHVRRIEFARSRQAKTEEASAPITLDRLQAYLRQRWPDRPGLRVTSYKRPPGGYQKTTVVFDTEDDNGRRDSLVLRAEAKNNAFIKQDGSDIRDEYDIVQFVRQAGVPVAEPMWFEEDEKKLGSRFFVSQKINGENYGNAVAASNITESIARSYMEAVAKVHKIPVSDRMQRLSIGHWIGLPTHEDNTRALIQYWRNQPNLKAANPSPLMEYLVAWLTENIPCGDILICLLHGDFGPHNTLVDAGKVSGILDWESARFGDPAEDVSWFLQSCAGQVDYGKAIDWYEEFTGHRLSEYRLRYYDVLGCLKIVACAGSVDAAFEASEKMPVILLDLSFRFGAYGTSTVGERIKIAESVLARERT